MCTKWYLPTVIECCSVRYYKVGHGSVRDFLNSFNAVTCGVVVLSYCCRVDNCCFGQSMSLIVGGVVATTTTTTLVVARRSFKFILLLRYFAQLVHLKFHGYARVVDREGNVKL